MLEFNEPYFTSWVKWHLYRKYKKRSRHSFREAAIHLRSTIRSLPKDTVVIDCGANVGDVTEYFLSKGMKVIAFEPDPVALAVLEARFSPRSKLTIEPSAVGARAGRASLFQTTAIATNGVEETISSSLTKRDVHSETPAAEVNVVNLVEYIRSIGEPVGVLKLDIEGCEAEIIDELIKTGTYKDIKLIIVETHERFSDELARKISEIKNYIEINKIKNILLGWH